MGINGMEIGFSDEIYNHYILLCMSPLLIGKLKTHFNIWKHCCSYICMSY